MPLTSADRAHCCGGCGVGGGDARRACTGGAGGAAGRHGRARHSGVDWRRCCRGCWMWTRVGKHVGLALDWWSQMPWKLCHANRKFPKVNNVDLMKNLNRDEMQTNNKERKCFVSGPRNKWSKLSAQSLEPKASRPWWCMQRGMHRPAPRGAPRGGRRARSASASGDTGVQKKEFQQKWTLCAGEARSS